MTDIATVENAFLKADQAGDADSARLLAAEVRRLRAEAPQDPTKGMSFGQKLGAGFGGGLVNLARGAAQLVGKGPTSEEVKATKERDAPLMSTGAGITGNIAANVVPAALLSMIPGANTYAGAGAVGALMGALQPAESGSERVKNVAVGGGAGVAGQGVANAVGRAITPVRSTLGPEAQRLAAVAEREGIPLDAAQRTGSKPLQTVNAVMENLPFTAGPEAAKKAAQGTAFNQAVLRRAGITADQATPDVLATQKRALGSQFESIAGRNSIDLNTGVLNDLTNIVSQAERRLTPAQFGTVSRSVDDILTQANGGILPGTNYQGWRSELGRLSRGNDAQAHYFGELKRALDRGFNSQISAVDSEAWRQASREYGNLKTIMQAQGGAGLAPNTGNISAAQLSQALAGSVGREGKALGRGDLNDLVRVGQTFVRDQVPNSGTAQRQLYQSLMTNAAPALIGAGVGAGGGYMTGVDPVKAAAGGAAALYSPRALQALLNNPAVANYLTQGVTNGSARLLANALQSAAVPAAVSSPMLLNSQ